jgi:hypothetical protein
MKTTRRPGGYGARKGVGRKKADDKRLAIWMLGGCGVVVSSIIVAMIVLKPTDVNPLTGCPTGNTAPQAHTIILIDETDRLPPSELKFVKDLIMTEYRWLPLMGRLTIRNIVADPDGSEDITICRIAEGSSTGGLIDNDRAIRERFDKIVGGRLESLFDDLKKAPVQDASPIMETMAETIDRSDFGSNVRARRLVVLSDFAQHSDLFSMYSDRGRRAKSLPESASEELDRDLAGIDVRLQYVRRRSLAGLQGGDHKRFWKAYVADQGAKSVEIDHGLLIGEAPDRETWVYTSPEKAEPPRRSGS